MHFKIHTCIENDKARTVSNGISIEIKRLAVRSTYTWVNCYLSLSIISVSSLGAEPFYETRNDSKSMKNTPCLNAIHIPRAESTFAGIAIKIRHTRAVPAAIGLWDASFACTLLTIASRKASIYALLLIWAEFQQFTCIKFKKDFQ